MRRTIDALQDLLDGLFTEAEKKAGWRSQLPTCPTMCLSRCFACCVVVLLLSLAYVRYGQGWGWPGTETLRSRITALVVTGS